VIACASRFSFGGGKRDAVPSSGCLPPLSSERGGCRERRAPATPPWFPSDPHVVVREIPFRALPRGTRLLDPRAGRAPRARASGRVGQAGPRLPGSATVGLSISGWTMAARRLCASLPIPSPHRGVGRGGTGSSGSLRVDLDSDRGCWPSGSATPWDIPGRVERVRPTCMPRSAPGMKQAWR